MKGKFCISVPIKEYKLYLKISQYLNHFKSFFFHIIVFHFSQAMFQHESETG